MTNYLHLNGERIAEVFDLQSHGGGEWSFSCSPPISVADKDYEIFPPGGKPMRIMISDLAIEGARSHIKAVEP